MSKDIKNITENIMDQINKGQIKMKPKSYFIIGSVLTFIGSVLAIIISTFLISLIRFSLRTSYGWRAQYKLDQMLSSFPWWTIILSIITLAVGIWLIKKYDFSYKIKPSFLILGFVIAIVLAGLITDMIGLNDHLSQKGMMKGVMHGYMRKSIQ